MLRGDVNIGKLQRIILATQSNRKIIIEHFALNSQE